MIIYIGFLMSVLAYGAVAGDICTLPAKTGPCRAHMPRYFFNSKTGKCESFVYGGCQGNENNFQDEKECLAKCRSKPASICRLPAETGPCKAYFPRFFFNHKTGQCEKFVYGGCQGNANNFKDEKECSARCLMVKKEASVDADASVNCFVDPCDVGGDDACGQDSTCVADYSEGCNYQCIPKGRCSLDAKTGPCRANIPRWYYDSNRGRCEEFVYGGCQGNGNNFESAELCADACVKQADTGCGPICKMYCEFGFEKDANGCEICKCKSQPTCPKILCDLHCDNGFAKGENGCEVCRCRRSELVSKKGKCNLKCPYGLHRSGACRCACAPFKREVNCLVNPCMARECPSNRDAICVPDYCGGCNYAFWNGKTGFRVKC